MKENRIGRFIQLQSHYSPSECLNITIVMLREHSLWKYLKGVTLAQLRTHPHLCRFTNLIPRGLTTFVVWWLVEPSRLNSGCLNSLLFGAWSASLRETPRTSLAARVIVYPNWRPSAVTVGVKGTNFFTHISKLEEKVGPEVFLRTIHLWRVHAFKEVHCFSIRDWWTYGTFFLTSYLLYVLGDLPQRNSTLSTINYLLAGV